MYAISRRSAEVAREDLVLFLNACFACTGQREFYDEHASDQRLSAAFLHAYILGNYRRLYARTLAVDINDFSRTRILFNLLSTGRDTPADFREEENALLGAALRSLPPQRVYKLFRELRERRINNRRTRALIAAYLAARSDATFDAVKYRGKVRAAVAHAHLTLPGEFGAFLFGDWQRRRFETPLFETFRQAYFSQEAIYALPFTVAEGLAARRGIARDTFLARYAVEGHLTQGEKLRLQEAAGRAKRTVKLDFDLGRAPLTRLTLYVLSLSTTEREERREELETALRTSARRALWRHGKTAGLAGRRVAAVLDSSYSSGGSEEKRRRPLAVALAVHYLLGEATDTYHGFWTGRRDNDPLQITARGATDLATPLLDALAESPDLIVIVSDGVENDPPDGAREVLRVWRERLDPEKRIEILHLNPVFAAESYEVRPLAPGIIPTVGLRDGEDLPTALQFARFADGMATLEELEAYLHERVRALIATKGGGGDEHDSGASEQ